MLPAFTFTAPWDRRGLVRPSSLEPRWGGRDDSEGRPPGPEGEVGRSQQADVGRRPVQPPQHAEQVGQVPRGRDAGAGLPGHDGDSPSTPRALQSQGAPRTHADHPWQVQRGHDDVAGPPPGHEGETGQRRPAYLVCQGLPLRYITPSGQVQRGRDDAAGRPPGHGGDIGQRPPGHLDEEGSLGRHANEDGQPPRGREDAPGSHRNHGGNPLQKPSEDLGRQETSRRVGGDAEVGDGEAVSRRG
mmetsp:Transcript_184100/g.583864  ORF Transcript_184100/g.583864 Transcript_184100/m.583864 type:complete len:244 (+) Transcript_184100:3-734(+)